MKTSRSLSIVAWGIGMILVAALPAGVARAQAPTVRALVLSDLGETAGIEAILAAEGWEVSSSNDPSIDISDLTSNYDVVWIPAATSSTPPHVLVTGELVVFTLSGGVVVVTGVDGASLDVAPGGTDAEALSSGAGPVSIVDTDHPSISGAGIGGTVLTAAELDPSGVGGRGSLQNTPDGAIVIAQNSDGPVAVEYSHGNGHVLISSLRDPAYACTRNVVLYAGSLVP